MAALLDDPAVIENQDPIGEAQGRTTVRNKQGGPAEQENRKLAFLTGCGLFAFSGLFGRAGLRHSGLGAKIMKPWSFNVRPEFCCTQALCRPMGALATWGLPPMKIGRA